jgi:hypothetical protein
VDLGLGALGKYRNWGDTDAEREWLKRAGFTRRNTRRAILHLLRNLLWEGERIHVLTTGTYRFQMGYLAVTGQRVIVGMSWAFFPFIRKHLGIPLELVRIARHEHNPWGAKLEVFSQTGKFSFGDLADEEAERLAALIVAGAKRAVAAQPPPGAPAPGEPSNPAPRGLASPSGTLPSRPT